MCEYRQPMVNIHVSAPLTDTGQGCRYEERGWPTHQSCHGLQCGVRCSAVQWCHPDRHCPVRTRHVPAPIVHHRYRTVCPRRHVIRWPRMSRYDTTYKCTVHILCLYGDTVHLARYHIFAQCSVHLTKKNRSLSRWLTVLLGAAGRDRFARQPQRLPQLRSPPSR
jgi:hypothetical protein